MLQNLHSGNTQAPLQGLRRGCVRALLHTEPGRTLQRLGPPGQSVWRLLRPHRKSVSCFVVFFKPGELLKVHSVFLRWSTQKHCESWHCCSTDDPSYSTKQQNWNQPWFWVKRQEVIYQCWPRISFPSHLLSLINLSCSRYEVKLTTAPLNLSNCYKTNWTCDFNWRAEMCETEDIRLLLGSDWNSRACALHCTRTCSSVFINSSAQPCSTLASLNQNEVFKKLKMKKESTSKGMHREQWEIIKLERF